MNPVDSHDAPAASRDGKVFFQTLEAYRLFYDKYTECRQGRSAYQAKRAVDEMVAPQIVHEDTWLTVPIDGADKTFFEPCSQEHSSEVSIWLRTKCPVCGEVSAKQMIADTSNVFTSYAQCLASCRRCHSFFYAVDGVVRTPDEDPWTAETRQDSLGEDYRHVRPNSSPEEIRFFNALREYKNRYGEVRAARAGHSAQSFNQLVRKSLELVMPSTSDACTEELGKPRVRFFEPFSEGLSQNVWVRTKCPNCGEVAAFRMHVSSKRGLFGSFCSSIARCRHCSSYYYTADGIVASAEEEPWTAATSRDSLGRVADRWKRSTGYGLVIAILVILLLIGIIAVANS